jgi:hypothetical protein
LVCVYKRQFSGSLYFSYGQITRYSPVLSRGNLGFFKIFLL